MRNGLVAIALLSLGLGGFVFSDGDTEAEPIQWDSIAPAAVESVQVETAVGYRKECANGVCRLVPNYSADYTPTELVSETTNSRAVQRSANRSGLFGRMRGRRGSRRCKCK